MGKKRRGNGMGTLVKRSADGPWVAVWWNATGKRKWHTTGTTDRQAAERILSKCVNDAALRREGVIDPHLDGIAGQSRRAIVEHRDDFEAKMTAAGRKPKHVAMAKRYIRLVAEAASWTSARTSRPTG